MTRIDIEDLERKLVQARRFVLEPNDPLTKERLTQLIKDLELRLHEQQTI
jgi:hypothetical protein